MVKAVLLVVLTYAGYWLAWFVLLLACYAAFGHRRVASAQYGVLLAMLGTLALGMVSVLLAKRWLWNAAPPGPLRVALLTAFVAIMLGTLGLQVFPTLLVFDR